MRGSSFVATSSIFFTCRFGRCYPLIFLPISLNTNNSKEMGNADVMPQQMESDNSPEGHCRKRRKLFDNLKGIMGRPHCSHAINIINDLTSLQFRCRVPCIPTAVTSCFIHDYEF